MLAPGAPLVDAGLEMFELDAFLVQRSADRGRISSACHAVQPEHARPFSLVRFAPA
jgi:hypothetical protein